MADRRRRKCPTNENSDVGSDESGDDQVINTSNQGSEGGNSEYESVDEDELLNEDEATDEKGELAPASEENEESKSLDHDEDRKNPQYIPKKGTFYEHDDRTMGEGEEVQEEETEKSAPQEKETKKKVWKEDGKWQHDRFSIYDQSPKSREELVATYGYDIRNEEGPPRARRRRRYGRGPNKYTRNWEDMDAYSKPTRGKPEARRGKGRGHKNLSSPINFTNNPKDFPSLPGTRDDIEQIESESFKRVTTEASHIVDAPKYAPSPVVAESYDSGKIINKNVTSNDQGSKAYIEEANQDVRSLGRGTKSNRRARAGLKGLQRSHNYHEGNQFVSKGRRDTGRGRGEGKPRPSGWVSHVPQQALPVSTAYQQKEIQEITEELKTVTITPSQKEDHHYKKRGVDNRRNTIPPRLQESMRGNKSAGHISDSNSVSSKPKRYSSQRQRSLQDQLGQYHHPQAYYDQNSPETGFNNKIYEQTTSSPVAGTPSQLPLSGQAAQPPPPPFVAPYTTTSASTYPAPPPARLFPSGAPQPHLIGPPVAGPPIGAPPPVGGPGVPGPPVPGTVGGPPVTGPPFLPPENMINYAAGAPGLVATPHPPQFPPFQAFTPVSQQQPQEIYSNGVTYYNTQSQQHLPRINPVFQKRPKLAIPIVPPPERRNSSKQRLESEREIVRENHEGCSENNSNDCLEETPENHIEESKLITERVNLEESDVTSEEKMKPISPSLTLEKISLDDASSIVKEAVISSELPVSEPSNSCNVEESCSEKKDKIIEEVVAITEPNASTLNGEQHDTETSVSEKTEPENIDSDLKLKKENDTMESEKISVEPDVIIESDPNPILEAT